MTTDTVYPYPTVSARHTAARASCGTRLEARATPSPSRLSMSYSLLMHDRPRRWSESYQFNQIQPTGIFPTGRACLSLGTASPAIFASHRHITYAPPVFPTFASVSCFLPSPSFFSPSHPCPHSPPSTTVAPSWLRRPVHLSASGRRRGKAIKPCHLRPPDVHSAHRAKPARSLACVEHERICCHIRKILNKLPLLPCYRLICSAIEPYRSGAPGLVQVARGRVRVGIVCLTSAVCERGGSAGPRRWMRLDRWSDERRGAAR
ncbi:hypothetical protein WOLCODRAFT_155854 [Wolfiporia cocos MD-104 SS10]|uniref:Uncharacterized protein n=1 Tax=Wolfiporia cocos (strain MD-104) TaxID=742152 RepID=A0A2H3IZ01_WOLCO|nr:hypothetical protein WOLCODRAFT_155854 [Wolfiporia cocos MD-104 SS10]